MGRCKGVRIKLARIRLRDGDNCWVCGLVMRFDGPCRSGRKNPGRIDATLDHVVPWADGGRNYHTNLRLAHRSCNNTRHGFDITPELAERCARLIRWPVIAWLLGEQQGIIAGPKRRQYDCFVIDMPDAKARIA